MFRRLRVLVKLGKERREERVKRVYGDKGGTLTMCAAVEAGVSAAPRPDGEVHGKKGDLRDIVNFMNFTG